MNPNQAQNDRAMALYRTAKSIDGRPDATGTYPIFVSRTAAATVAKDYSLFYEPLSSYNDVVGQLNKVGRLMQSGCEFAYVPKVGLSVRIFESLYNSRDGVFRLPARTEREVSIHYLSVDLGADFTSSGIPIINSWGERWGKSGTGVIPKAYLVKYLVEAWVTKYSVPGSFQIYQRAYDDGTRMVFRVYEFLSYNNDRVEVHRMNVYGTREVVAWSHLHMSTNAEGRGIVKEFFVYPKAQRKGYGTLLESFTVERARAYGMKRLSVLIHEADGYAPNLHALRCFADARGYEHQWVAKERPSVVAVMSKYLDL